MGRLVDLTGQRFGRWLVLERGENAAAGPARWTCRCDCGGIKLVWSTSLLRGESLSCGCLQKELTIARSTTHGHARRGGMTAEHYAWSNMLKRCYYPRYKFFKNYGGRANPITVCSEWRASYLAFFAHIGPRPGKGYSLDRINNDQGYVPGNVRWSTAKEQANNRRPRRQRERAA